MSGGVTVSGGAGGIEAHFDDMLATQRRLDATGDVLRAAGSRARAVSVDPAVIATGVLCPGELASVEQAAALAGWLPGSATWLGLELEVVSAVLTEAIDLYRDADQLLASVEEDLETLTGMLMAPLLLGGGLLAAATLLSSPTGWATLLTAYLERDRLGDAAMESLYDNPWMLDALTDTAPGLVQGLGLSVLGPWARLLTGGRWPTGDYEDSVTGLQALLGLAGQLQDVGEPVVGEPQADTSQSFLLGPDTFVDNVLAMEWQTYGDPQIRVTPVVGADGTRSVIVNVPGTEDWGTTHQGNYFDLTSNVQLMGQHDAAIQRAVEAAMRKAGVTSQTPVMLVGHSQGGIIAASIAADRHFNVESVVTAGSPIARIPIPDDVQVLSLENRQDVVPKLDGRDNPGTANWTTVTGDLAGTQSETADGSTIGAAHKETSYRQTGSSAESQGMLDDWKRRNSAFVPGTSGSYATVTVPIGSEG